MLSQMQLIIQKVAERWSFKIHNSLANHSVKFRFWPKCTLIAVYNQVKFQVNRWIWKRQKAISTSAGNFFFFQKQNKSARCSVHGSRRERIDVNGNCNDQGHTRSRGSRWSIDRRRATSLSRVRLCSSLFTTRPPVAYQIATNEPTTQPYAHCTYINVRRIFGIMSTRIKLNIFSVEFRITSR